jgi:hypothetical protein
VIGWLRPWVTSLGLREQGTLVTGTRGCDLAPKMPLDSIERQLTAYLRWLVGTPYDEREVDSTVGCFMRSAPPDRVWKPSELEHYPLHWYVHLMHAFEVVGYRHPDLHHRHWCLVIYNRLVHAMHLTPETESEMATRLDEDRIASGEIVS